MSLRQLSRAGTAPRAPHPSRPHVSDSPARLRLRPTSVRVPAGSASPDWLFSRPRFAGASRCDPKLDSLSQVCRGQGGWRGCELSRTVMRSRLLSLPQTSARTSSPSGRSATRCSSAGPPSRLAISRAGELAILRAAKITLNIYHRLGVLARVPLGGGFPRDVLGSTRYADWAPDGTDLAAIHDTADRRRLEYPIGMVLYNLPHTSHNTLVAPRISRSGDHVAFFEGFGPRVRRWAVTVVDRAGRKTTLMVTGGRQGVVWRLAGRQRERAVRRRPVGRERLLPRVPATVELHDGAPDGRVLLSLTSYRTFARGFAPGDPTERELALARRLGGGGAVARRACPACSARSPDATARMRRSSARPALPAGHRPPLGNRGRAPARRRAGRGSCATQPRMCRSITAGGSDGRARR
jgi:hypothetical protein